MAYIYEVAVLRIKKQGAKDKDESYRHFYANEGEAIRATKRSADEVASEHGGELRYTKWTDDEFVVGVVEGERWLCTARMTRHAVL